MRFKKEQKAAMCNLCKLSTLTFIFYLESLRIYMLVRITLKVNYLAQTDLCCKFLQLKKTQTANLKFIMQTISD